MLAQSSTNIMVLFPRCVYTHRTDLLFVCGLLAGLLALSSTKGLSEELLLGLGEAAAAAAGDVSGFDPGLLLWSNLDSLADCVDAAAGVADTAGETRSSAQQAQAAAMDVDGAADAGGSSSISSSRGRGGVQEYLLAELGKMAVAPKEEVR
jgi:hypothetical protein